MGPVVQSIVILTTSLRCHFVKYMPTTLSNPLLFLLKKCENLLQNNNGFPIFMFEILTKRLKLTTSLISNNRPQLICISVSMQYIGDLNGCKIDNFQMKKMLLFFFFIVSKHRSLVVRKPVFGISDQPPHIPGCTTTQDGWRLEISYI